MQICVGYELFSQPFIELRFTFYYNLQRIKWRRIGRYLGAVVAMIKAM
jgi:hypothetical protein